MYFAHCSLGCRSLQSKAGERGALSLRNMSGGRVPFTGRLAERKVRAKNQSMLEVYTWEKERLPARALVAFFKAVLGWLLQPRVPHLQLGLTTRIYASAACARGGALHVLLGMRAELLFARLSRERGHILPLHLDSLVYVLLDSRGVIARGIHHILGPSVLWRRAHSNLRGATRWGTRSSTIAFPASPTRRPAGSRKKKKRG